MEGGPVRTCIGCGKKALKGELRRLALSGSGPVGSGAGHGEVAITVDHGGKLPGRGAYLCGAGCLAAAVKKKALQRAFRGKSGPTDLERLEVALRES